jgi:hypothetical protein
VKTKSNINAIAAMSPRSVRQYSYDLGTKKSALARIVIGALPLVYAAFAADSGSASKTIESRSLNTGSRVSSSTTTPEIKMPAAVADPNLNHGATYGVWGANWWQWVFSLPVHDAQNNITHPLLTTGAVNCAIGQSGAVWFLAGTLSGGTVFRTCSVPRDTKLFFPILNTWGDNTGYDHPFNLTLPELQTAIAVAPVPGSLHAKIDGVSVALSDSNRGTAAFSYTVPNVDNLLQYLGGQVPGPGWPYGNTPNGVVVAPVASDGYWLMVEPLSPGTHTVNFGGAMLGGFSIDVTYTLVVN